MKRILRMVGIILVLFLVAILALPLIINVNRFRPRLEEELTAALGRQVKVGNLKLSIVAARLSAEDLSIADDPAFSQSPFIRAKSLEVGVRPIPLIFSKTLEIEDLTLLQPEIFLVHAASGQWNFSGLGGNSAPAKGATTRDANPPNANLAVRELDVTRGRLTVSTLHSSARAQVYDSLDLRVRSFSFASEFPFTLSTNLPGGGSAKLDGIAGPVNAKDAFLTPIDARILVRRFDMTASGFFSPSTGIGGVADLSGTIRSDGAQARIQGGILFDKLKLSPHGQPAARPVQVAYTVTHDLPKHAGEVMQGEITVSKALAQLTGTYRFQGETTLLNMKFNGQGMPVDDIEAMLPPLGVVLPSGSSLQGGTVWVTLSISGPTDRLVIEGPVKLSDTKLAGFDLGSKLTTISRLAGTTTGSDTTIQNLNTYVRVSPEGIRTDAIRLSIPPIGVITGAGSISPGGALNYRMTAAPGSSGALAGLPPIVSLGGAGAGIPFVIQGTASNPTFIPDVRGIVGSQFENPLKVRFPAGNTGSPAGPLAGFLGKKKKN
ncbi:MAG TPA: AsmA family protein [Terriglobales bacterium]|nr:AsmA family protein [Terriglobales bacterium]